MQLALLGLDAIAATGIQSANNATNVPPYSIVNSTCFCKQ